MNKNKEVVFKSTNGVEYVNADLVDENGDAITNNVNYLDFYSKPGISFGCLEQLKIPNEKFQIVSYDDKASIRLSQKQLTESFLSKFFNKGYSLISLSNEFDINVIYQLNNRYKSSFKKNVEYIKSCSGINFLHKAGTVLIKYNKTYFIMGFDDGQYFGCELPKVTAATAPKTIEEGLKLLQPKEVTKSNFIGRQGEWFMIKSEIPVKDVPLNKRFSMCDDSYASCILPKDSMRSNDHAINADWFTLLDGDLHWYNVVVFHDQHEEMKSYGLVRFIKNTAVRSVSVNGVD